jgi:hypothetical protein
MNEEDKAYVEHFRKLNEQASQPQPKKEVSGEVKALRIIALLIGGAIVIYLCTAAIW